MVALTVRKNVSLALIKASRDHYFLLIYVIQNVPFFFSFIITQFCMIRLNQIKKSKCEKKIVLFSITC